MRTKKALINSSMNILSFAITFFPNIIIRKLFLEKLGSEMLGLNSLYSNIIGWLSIFEMGIGTAIIFSLYKPYAENDRKKVKAHINFYGKFYRGVGVYILIMGIFIIPFLKYLIKDQVNLQIAIMGFVLFLLNSFSTYMFSHKICILNVAQQYYKITIGTMVSKLIIAILQIVMFYIYPNFILFISLQLMVNVGYLIIINIYINRRYPWLKDNKEKLDCDEKKSLQKNVRAMFMHKIGALIVNSTDNIVISKFVGLTSLANYTNYQLVISSLQNVIGTALGGVTASIGNMLTNNNKEQAYDIHKKLFFLNFWIVSFITISLYNTLNQFIAVWVGEKYLLDNLTYVVILINLYFAAMRESVEQFKSAGGIFYNDRYAPVAESIINLISSIILAKHIGIAGVFIGTLISNFAVIFWMKPYLVYKYVFDKNVIKYFKMYLRYLSIAFIPLVISNYCTSYIKYQYSLSSFIINCVLNILIINVIYLFIFYNSYEFKYYKNILISILKNK